VKIFLPFFFFIFSFLNIYSNENDTLLLTVYPNPAENFVIIENSFHEGTLLAKLYSIKGNEYSMASIFEGTGKHYFDLSKVKKGDYILKIIIDNSIQQFNIIKQ